MAEMKVDCTGETCPVPLVETRKALRKAKDEILEKIEPLWDVKEVMVEFTE